MLAQLFSRKPKPRKIPLLRDSKNEPPAIGHLLTSGKLQQILREAENGNTKRLFSVYRDQLLADAHIQGEVNKRLLAVLGDPMLFTPAQGDQGPNAAASTIVEQMWGNLTGGMNDRGEPTSKLDALAHLMFGSLYPVSVVEKVYRRSLKPHLRFELAALNPIPFHLLDFTAGYLRIEDVDDDGVPLGTYHNPHPDTYIVHRGHLLTGFSDCWGGPLRAGLFWWLLKSMDRDWWGRFLERYGAPFMLAKYDQHDDQSRLTLTRAMSQASRLFGLAVSRETEVELREASMAAGDAYAQFHTVANAELSKLIIGQTMSAEAQSTGLGSSQGDLHGAVRRDIRQFDDRRLAETLRNQLFGPYLRINGIQGSPPEITFGEQDDEGARIVVDVLNALPTAGLELTDDGIAAVTARTGVAVQRQSRPEAGPAQFNAAPAPALVQQGLSKPQAALVRTLSQSNSAQEFERALSASQLAEDPLTRTLFEDLMIGATYRGLADPPDPISD